MAARARAAAPFWLLAAAAVTLLVAAASAQSGGSSDDCTSALVSLSPCMGYISGNGTSAPSASCCSQLKAVVQSKPQCLCAALGSDASSSLGGVTIDRSRALGLPAACNVQTPPVSQCNNGKRAAVTVSRTLFSFFLPHFRCIELTPLARRVVGRRIEGDAFPAIWWCIARGAGGSCARARRGCCLRRGSCVSVCVVIQGSGCVASCQLSLFRTGRGDFECFVPMALSHL